eukprot:CAMPEP_0113486650 /NCGR_PEP_ID=MMETSP0014_2-20120614/25105_1 /TAXON_ID=2857 /ORGANISM="Nitzschia sp." /LENGTH=842 /DNA_ID=CAMNT_0000380327 /DNA_START=59 /DNA_END=2583 /DNA_ORIENTATION=- /assembly_acc=CAM_ASM_000159
MIRLRSAVVTRLSSSSSFLSLSTATTSMSLTRRTRSYLEKITTSTFSSSAYNSNSSSSSSSSSSTFISSTDDRPFQKVLVANRGEIACRVIRTCQRMGIPTVALYSVADGPGCLHASMADERYQIGTGPHPTDSYLLHDQVLDIALRSGAQAIHPGYGFLSENASFCKAVANTPGLTFVGPGVDAITAMGSKSESKAIMEDAGVPTTPGYYENVTGSGDGVGETTSQAQDPQKLLHEAVQIGFPLLIKAVMGGGGKGMRLVWSENEFLDKLEACQRESLNSFGDERVLLEKYLIKPRHVEIQVVADHHGNVVHLYERDCSLQRRHQKIIEEAPASDLPTELRERFGEMGKKAAQAVGYVNAGTVEFLLDTQAPDQFYFCEMNTRLQVEHPITELITGQDLVEWQLRVAAGQELPIRNQEDIPCHGHAFEARIYAENPDKGFLPATGQVWHHQPPANPNGEGVDPSGGVRVDTGIQAGQDVGVYYDPMICKLIVHDETREAALQKLVTSLKQYQIAGVPTNIDFLVRCAQHQGFQIAGEVNTGFLEDYMDDVLPHEQKATEGQASTISSSSSSSHLSTAVGVFVTMLKLEGRIGITDLETERRKQSSPWNSLSGSWTLGGLSQRNIRLADGTSVQCTSLRDGSFEITIPSLNDKEGEGSESSSSPPAVIIHLNGTLSSNGRLDVVVNHTQRISGTAALRPQRDDGDDSNDDAMFNVCIWPQSSELFHNSDHDYAWNVFVENPMSVSRSSHGSSSSSPGSAHGSIKAPMPGKISRINVSIGDTVKDGDVLMLMEAMKMEHPIVSPVSGIITELSYEVDDIVSDGVKLAVVENNTPSGEEDDQAA